MSQQPVGSQTDQRIKIYFLPNLMTAGNLFCGFVALTKIVEANLANGDFRDIRVALIFILLACFFDLLDGRLARMGGHDSPFGREFDSLADVISFGAAPAFLVHRVVLKDVFQEHVEIGWFIASIYLICGAVRLARFNCLSIQGGSSGSKEFLGFPIPAAAGLVASLTLFLIWLDEKNLSGGYLRWVLPFILLLLSWMMVSEVKYPSFKKLDLKATRPFIVTLIGILFIGSLVILGKKILVFVLPLGFTTYLIYGFVRPYMPRRIRHEIEDEGEDDEEEEKGAAGP